LSIIDLPQSQLAVLSTHDQAKLRRRKILGRLGTVLLTLLVIAYLTLYGLILAERGRAKLPAQPLSAAWEALSRLGGYIIHHPTTYYWQKVESPAFQLIAQILANSVVLLSISLLVAILLGVPLGIAGALSKRKSSATFMLILSVLGISTPSFLLAMLFWIINIQVHNWFNIKVLPSAGFGWDTHMVLPVLVLAMRPLAQIAQVTYVSMANILNEDYLRTARAKGLPWRLIRDRHALRNILIPILTTFGTSLRFSLASLPVVEFFFSWPGVGLTLLQAINLGNGDLVTDLILLLGLFFLAVNFSLELLFPILDPRLKENGGTEEQLDHESFREWLHNTGADLLFGLQSLRQRLLGRSGRSGGLPELPAYQAAGERSAYEEPAIKVSRWWLVRIFFGNSSLLVGGLLVLGLLYLAIDGGRLTNANPYQIHGVMTINHVVGAPPFHPSSVFPWGSDQIGRDLQSLVLAGAQQTLTLAFFGMLARILVGTLLGALAGWRQNSWLDRLVMGAVGVWAAFPVTLFAMIVIQALGIQQGMSVFVIGICVVGWAESAQYIRSQVIAMKPELFIEAARSVGSRSSQILSRHVLPNMFASLLVLAALEMGGVLMLLADLGFLNIFLGGGYRIEIRPDVVAFFSDVPEWGALLANIRNWWRSYPWMAWYPGIAFLLSILAFNIFGQGLRRFLEESRVNVNRIFNRFTVLGSLAILGIMAYTLKSSSPTGMYRSEALKFDAQRAMQTIDMLSSPQFSGRETGTPGAQYAALYIAQQMQQIGLLPAGDNDSFIQTLAKPRLHLLSVPQLQILDNQGQPISNLVYRQDYVERGGAEQTNGEADGSVIGVALSSEPGPNANDPYGLKNNNLLDKIVLIKDDEYALPFNPQTFAGVLLVSDNPQIYQRRLLYRSEFYRFGKPVLYITSKVAEQLLGPSGNSLEDLQAQAQRLHPGQAYLTAPGASVHMEINAVSGGDRTEKTYNVIGYIPGSDAQGGLDANVIMVSAYYDGVGTGPDGTLYPGANDNASGVAAVLEMARVLKNSPYQPKRTVVFVAWAGGERYDGLDTNEIMNARHNFNLLSVEAVIELSGLGAGNGSAIVAGENSSYRMVQLLQKSAGEFHVPVTARGRGPNYGLPAGGELGGRKAITLYMSWDGSDISAHTPADSAGSIDPTKLQKSGRSALLALFIASREQDY
jgi:ABC-type dipeptide/oligopeptide/nickel transport system permease component